MTGDDTADGIHISGRGVVTITSEETFWACFYRGTYGSGMLVDGWRVREGITKFQWFNDSCDPVEGQLDVIGDDSCPAKPFFEDYRDGRTITVAAGKTPEECEDPKCEWRGEFCSTYLSNTGSGYYTTDDGAPWLGDLYLRSGRRDYCWPHAVDDSRLCLRWRNEEIGCANASTGVTSSWHGDVEFRAECVYPE